MIDAPALKASRASAAICAGVTGTGCCFGLVSTPVSAQVRMALSMCLRRFGASGELEFDEQAAAAPPARLGAARRRARRAPPPPAVTHISIFIASTQTSGWPATTSSPDCTASCRDHAGHRRQRAARVAADLAAGQRRRLAEDEGVTRRARGAAHRPASAQRRAGPRPAIRSAVRARRRRAGARCASRRRSAARPSRLCPAARAASSPWRQHSSDRSKAATLSGRCGTPSRSANAAAARHQSSSSGCGRCISASPACCQLVEPLRGRLAVAEGGMGQQVAQEAAVVRQPQQRRSLQRRAQAADRVVARSRPWAISLATIGS